MLFRSDWRLSQSGGSLIVANTLGSFHLKSPKKSAKLHSSDTDFDESYICDPYDPNRKNPFFLI